MSKNDNAALTTARVWQPPVCAALLLIVLASSLLVDWMATSETVGVWMDSRRAAIMESVSMFARQYLDTEDREVLDDIPKLDCSQGGVYFFGASNLKWATRVPDLPPNERRLIHNFGCGEGSPDYQRQFVEYLINYKNLLQAGADKTLIVYGANLLNIPPAIDNGRKFFPNLWRRYGLYEYDFATGIHPVYANALAARLCLEKAKCCSFVQGCMDCFCRSLIPKTMRRRLSARDAAVIAQNYAQRLGPQWREDMLQHKAALQRFVDSVQRHGAHVTIVLMPLASWHQPMPYTAPYRRLVADVCKAKSVPLVDLSALLSDDLFEDHIHASERGVDILDPALMKIARDFLRKTGALPTEKAH